jgi:hypothetical protein
VLLFQVVERAREQASRPHIIAIVERTLCQRTRWARSHNQGVAARPRRRRRRRRGLLQPNPALIVPMMPVAQQRSKQQEPRLLPCRLDLLDSCRSTCCAVWPSASWCLSTRVAVPHSGPTTRHGTATTRLYFTSQTMYARPATPPRYLAPLPDPLPSPHGTHSVVHIQVSLRHPPCAKEHYSVRCTPPDATLIVCLFVLDMMNFAISASLVLTTSTQSGGSHYASVEHCAATRCCSAISTSAIHDALDAQVRRYVTGSMLHCGATVESQQA